MKDDGTNIIVSQQRRDLVFGDWAAAAIFVPRRVWIGDKLLNHLLRCYFRAVLGERRLTQAYRHGAPWHIARRSRWTLIDLARSRLALAAVAAHQQDPHTTIGAALLPSTRLNGDTWQARQTLQRRNGWTVRPCGRSGAMPFTDGSAKFVETLSSRRRSSARSERK